ncbi:MAG: hypothetical protein WD226_03895 [Planctomycetota bacterium]
MKSLSLAAVAAATFFSTLEAQTLVPLVTEGDSVPGVGLVTSIANIAINDAGDWRVEADTDNAVTTSDSVLLLNGALELREGQTLVGPIQLGSFDSVNVPFDVTGGWNFFLDGTTGSSDDSGIFHGTNMLIQEGGTTIAPTLDPTATYLGWFETKAQPGVILMMSSLDDPTIIGSGTVDRVLLKAFHDGAGTLLSEQVVVAEDQLLPGQTELVVDLETGPHNFAMNASGAVMFIADLAGDTTLDHAVYIDSTLLAQEGSPSPVVGRNWSSLSLAEVDLNDAGDFVISGSLDGDTTSNLLIEKSGTKFRQEGDSLPDIAPFQLTSFGSGPVHIANNGDVLWYGDWDDPDTTRDTGLFINDTLIVQEGVTLLNGAPITTLRGVQDGFFLSRNGRFVMFECVQGSNDVAVLIDRGGFLDLPSCVPNAGSLAHTAGVPAIGQSFQMTFDNGLGAGSVPLLAASNAPIFTFPPCGATLAIGELMIAVGAPNPIVLESAPLWFPGSPSSLVLVLPNDPGLIGREFWVQGVFANGAVTPSLGLTNAFVLTIGE